MLRLREAIAQSKASSWEKRGRKPYTRGYHPARWRAIQAGLKGNDARFGWRDAGLDERVVEYSWAFDRVAGLRRPGAVALDAGSVLNHKPVLDCWREREFPPLSIVTLAYEGSAQVSTDVRYEFADLRRLPYRDEWFSIVLCLSTLEHVGLDNKGYGAQGGRDVNPDAEAIRAMNELRRVTVPGGTLLLSVPFGTRSDRGWFRVLNQDDLLSITTVDGWRSAPPRIFRATRDGWRETPSADAADAGYNEPPSSTGRRTAPEWVAAAEAVALVELKRV